MQNAQKCTIGEVDNGIRCLCGWLAHTVMIRFVVVVFVVAVLGWDWSRIYEMVYVVGENLRLGIRYSGYPAFLISLYCPAEWMRSCSAPTFHLIGTVVENEVVLSTAPFLGQKS